MKEEVIFSAEDLQKNLEYLKPVTVGIDLVELASCIIFHENYMSVFNGEMFVKRVFQSGITGAVQAQEFLKFVFKLSPNTKITLSKIKKDDQDMVIISSKRGQAGFASYKVPDNRKDQIPAPKTWNKLPDDFSTFLKFAQIATKKSSSHPILGNILWNETGLWSCDNFRIMHCPFSTIEIKNNQILFPVNCVNELIQFMNHWGFSPGWLHFRDQEEKTIYSCRLAEGDYPDVSKLLSMKNEIEHISFPLKVIKALDRASIFSNDQQAIETTFIIKEGILTLLTRGISGWSKERFKIDSKIDLKFTMDPKIMQDALLLGNEIIIGEQTLMIKGKQFIHVLSLH